MKYERVLYLSDVHSSQSYLIIVLKSYELSLDLNLSIVLHLVMANSSLLMTQNDPYFVHFSD